MSYFMIILILYINLLNLSLIIQCLFLRNMEPLSFCYFLLPWQPNQEADYHNFSYFELPLRYPSNICTKLQWFWRSCHLKKKIIIKISCCHDSQTKWPLVLKHINWIVNHQKIITAKYGSHHGENEIGSFSNYKSMGIICCYGH